MGRPIIGTVSILDRFRRDTRQRLPLNEIIQNTVPIQHTFIEGTRPIENLPIVRRCIGDIADMINQTELEIVDDDNRVVARRGTLPTWILQPSGEFVLAELVHQAVWTLMINGYLRILASTRSDGTPMFIYVGTNALQTYTAGNGLMIYTDTVTYAEQSTVIVADSIAVRRRLTIPGRPNGLSEYQPAKTLLNAALHAQDVISRFFGSNMFTDLIFMHEGEYTKNAGVELLEQLARRHAGPMNSFRPLVSDRRWKVDRLRESNQANQVVELISMLNSAICSQVFGIDPMYMSLDRESSGGSDKSLTYKNAANLRAQIWKKPVEPIADLIASCLSDYLPRGLRFKFNASDMLRGSPSDRAALALSMAQVNAAMSSSGGEGTAPSQGSVFSVEEIRQVVGYG